MAHVLVERPRGRRLRRRRGDRAIQVLSSAGNRVGGHGSAIRTIGERSVRDPFWSRPESPEDKPWFSGAIEFLLKDVGLDAKNRKFLWPDAGPPHFDESVQLVRKRGLGLPEDQIEAFLMFSVEAPGGPDGYSYSRTADLDRSPSCGFARSRRARTSHAQLIKRA